jgi:hypothetical protein
MVLILENKYEGMMDGAGADTDVVEDVALEEDEDVALEEDDDVALEEDDDVALEEDVEVGGDGTEPFLSGLLSKLGITSSNERIDTERNLQQGKCSNEELSKMH